MAREDRKNIRAERKEEKAQAKTSKRNVKTERKTERKASPPAAGQKKDLGRTQAMTDQARARQRAAARAFLPKEEPEAGGFKDFEGGGGWAYRKYADGTILITDAPGTNTGAIGMELSPGDRFYEQIEAEIGGRPVPQMAAPAAEPIPSAPRDYFAPVDETASSEPSLADVVRRVTGQFTETRTSEPGERAAPRKESPSRALTAPREGSGARPLGARMTVLD